ncbi:MAG: DUF2795 domain-containing protein [Motilibacteraceae bacterium]
MVEQRGSDKHSARVDDQLEHELEGMQRAGRSTHAEEWKDPEPSGEDQPDVDRVPDGTFVGGVPQGVTPEEVAARSDVARFLGLSAFPGDREALLAAAEANEAPDGVLADLRRLPAGEQFANLQDAWRALGGGTEERGAPGPETD